MAAQDRPKMKRLTKRDPTRESSIINSSPCAQSPRNFSLNSPAESDCPIRIGSSSMARSPLEPRSNIRGRISGPIPISTPLDDNFHLRSPSYLIASPTASVRTPTGLQLQILNSNSNVEPQASHKDQQQQSSPHPGVLERDFAFAPIEERTTSKDREKTQTKAKSGQVSPRLRDTTQTQKRDADRNRAVRQSVISLGGGGSKEKPQKRSTFRGAIGKLFGRRRKNPSQESLRGRQPGPGSNRPSTQHQRSATIDVISPRNQNQFEGEHKRSASLHPDYGSPDFGKALRSHNIGLEDRLAIESARSSMQSFSRRRGIGASIQAVRRYQARESMPSGLTPRPTSIHGRIVKDSNSSPDIDNDHHVHVHDPEEIGKAITSDFNGLKRRSRSLSAIAIPGASNGDEVGRRSRNGEIRYWRQSYDPEYKSPHASSHGVEDLEEKVEPKSDRTVTPPQPFSFGDMASIQMAGMKITHAATIDTRLGKLEKKARRLEKVVTEMRSSSRGGDCHILPDGSCPGSGPDVQNQNQNQSTTNINTPGTFYRPEMAHSAWSSQQWYDADTKQTSRPSTRHSHASSKSSFEQNATPHQQHHGVGVFMSSNNRSNPSISSPGNNNRLSVAATIRGVASLPALSQEVPAITSEQYAALMALIESERSSRQALEVHVKTLGHQVDAMARAMYGSGSSKPSFGGHSSQSRSAFEYNDDDEDNEGDDEGNHDRNTATKYVADHRTLSTQNSGILSSVRDDDESYITPAEEPDNDYNDVHPHHPAPSRTLSLSQMTMNRPRVSKDPMPKPF